MGGPREILQAVREGRTGIEEALNALKALPFEDLGFAKIDTHREIRCGFPEVIFCQGKTPEQIVEQKKPFVLARREEYRRFWEKNVRQNENVQY